MGSRVASVEPTAAEQCMEERKLYGPGCFTQLTHHSSDSVDLGGISALGCTTETNTKT